MKSIAAFLSGVGVAIAIAVGFELRAAGIEKAVWPEEQAKLDLNSASDAELQAMGISQELAAGIIENRPYRSKLELVERFVVPTDIYSQIRDKIIAGGATEPVKIAS